MDIKQAQGKKAALERAVCSLLCDFEQETGLQVDDIGLHTVIEAGRGRRVIAVECGVSLPA